jgi:serine/threonine-protein kinase
MARSKPVSVLRIGERVGRYEVLAEVAEGGMAAVYAARLSSIGGFGKILALKILLPHLKKDREFVNMFLDEARIASAIHHANVVQVFDVGEHDDVPYIVMEYLRGQSLYRTLRKARASEVALSGVLPAILARTAEGLHAAHETRDENGESLGVVHRDVSPQNVHVGYDGQVKVVDFGIASAKRRLTNTRSGQLKGKFRYLSPEQVRRDLHVDRRADVWALGVMAWESFAGRKLFVGDDDATTLWSVMNEPIPDLRTIVPDVPAEIAAIVAKSLERDRSKRPSTCAEVAGAFERARPAQPAAIAAAMAELFGAERTVEEERLAASTRERPAAIKESDPSESGPEPITIADEPRRRWGMWALAGLLVAGVGVAIVAYAQTFASTPASGDPIERAEPEPAPAREREAEAPVEAAAPVEPAIEPVESAAPEPEKRPRRRARAAARPVEVPAEPAPRMSSAILGNPYERP